jgi:hypothetical protein
MMELEAKGQGAKAHVKRFQGLPGTRHQAPGARPRCMVHRCIVA